jgi:hypothetical protein
MINARKFGESPFPFRKSKRDNFHRLSQLQASRLQQYHADRANTFARESLSAIALGNGHFTHDHVVTIQP